MEQNGDGSEESERALLRDLRIVATWADPGAVYKITPEGAKKLLAVLERVPQPADAELKRDAARWAFAVHNGMPVRNQTPHTAGVRWVATVGGATFYGDGPGSAVDAAISGSSSQPVEN